MATGLRRREGIKLTGAGYLPPVHVEAAVAALDLGKEWIGKGNREVQTVPVLHLRETATKMGLLRKNRGLLMVTSRGRALRNNPAGTVVASSGTDAAQIS